jgi:hypothetical protein
MKANKFTFVPAQGSDTILFDYYDYEELEKNGELIDQKIFTDKFVNFAAIQSFRVVLNHSKDYLAEIFRNRDYKKLLQTSLTVAKEDLNFVTPELAKEMSLKQKIENRNKLDISNNLKIKKRI